MKHLFATVLFGLTAAYGQTYHQAKAGIAAGDDINLYDNLISHPLYPYLAADYYQNNLALDSRIIPLFKDYYSAPPIKTLHNRWISHHFKQGNLQLVADNYYDTGSETANCMYRQAQLLLGNEKEALQGIKQVWLSPKSISDFCTPVFDRWAGKNEPDNILRRAKMAYFAGNGGFAQQMADKLGSAQGQSISLFGRFLRTPTLMLEYPASELISSPLRRELLPLALEKLVRKDSSRYAAFAMQFAKPLADNQAYQRMLTKLTRYLANRHDPQAQYTYALITSPNKDAGESLLRFLVGARDWRAIRQLVSLDNDDSMSLYWLARATEALGDDATAIYKKAAKTRSYYGFLAADKLGQPYAFNAEPIQPNRAVQANFDKNTSLVRAQLLYQHGDAISARREIFPLAQKMDKATQRQLAYWLSRQGFHHDAIYILGKMREWNDIFIRFPTPYNSQVAEANRITGTDPTWMYAIIRQESSMNPRAVSRARAKGLMQLIPSTARMMARDLGISLSGDDIFNPDINTKMGAEYLAQMYRRFGNVALSSAAYNAGPGRVEQWMVNGVDDMPIWVEKIPFDETRKYVKRIAEYQQVYAKHLNKKIPTLTEILTHKMQPSLIENIELID